MPAAANCFFTHKLVRKKNSAGALLRQDRPAARLKKIVIFLEIALDKSSSQRYIKTKRNSTEAEL